jgi:hypothetical protein
VKKVLLLTVIFWTVLQLDAKSVIFVNKNSNGDGSSWAQAFGNLQDALQVAQPGDSIWVAKGTYLPTNGTDRTISFQIPSDVAVYGGFAGNEANLTQRDWKNNLTILSGEIATPSVDDNSYTVVFTKGVSASTIVDGFVITGGTANGTSRKGDSKRCGGAWFNDGSEAESSPSINNCLFINNRGRDGAGLYNYANNGACNPSIINCQFISNIADLDGGAINNNGNYGSCNPYISNCLFEENEAAYGAGMINQGDGGETKPFINNCVFTSNMSYIKGSGIYNNRQEMGVCEPILSANRFADNKSSVGRDVSSTVNNARKNKSAVVFRSGF